MSKPSEWQEITDILTPEGIAKIQKGQTLTFDYEGSRNDYRVMENKNGHVWAKPITLHTMDEAKAKFSDEGLEPHPTNSHEVDLGENL